MKQLAAGAIALAILPAVAWAQEDGDLVAEDIIVSGGLAPVAASAYGRANSIVTAEDIERRQIREVSEALRALPGVSVSRSGGPGGPTQVRLRGAEGNHVLVLIDGVEVSAPQNGEYDFAGLLAADIDRIEVIRGPQSALYGSNATAGVISITTKRGARESFDAGGALEGGTNNSYLVSGFLRGGGEDFDLSFSAVGRRDGGFDVSDDVGGKEDEDKNLTFNAQANFDVTDAISVGGTIRFTNRTSDFDQFNFGAATREDLVTDSSDTVEQRELFASVNGSQETFGGRVEHGVQLSYSDITTQNFTDAALSSDVAGDRIQVGYLATVALDAPTLSAADHQLSFKADWERERFENVDPALVFDPTQLDRQTRNLFGFGGEYQGTFFDALNVQLGLRYDVNDDFKNAFTYGAGVSYFLDATNSRFHGSVSTGVTNPNFFEQFGFIPSSFVGNPDLEPEENFSWDVGVEQGFFDDRLVVDVTYFQARLENEIETVFDFTTFTTTPVNSRGTSRRQGVEVSAIVEPMDGLLINGSYTWLNADNPDRTVEVRRPRHEGGINVGYSFLGGNASIAVDGRFALGNYDSDFTFPAFGTTRVKLDDYFLLDIAGTYQVHENVALTARVENVTDSDYQELDGFATRGITGFGGIKVTF